MPKDHNDSADFAPEKNVGQVEALVSATLGGLLLVRGLLPRSISQAALLLVGGSLLYRGLTSHCPTYAALGVNTNKD